MAEVVQRAVELSVRAAPEELVFYVTACSSPCASGRSRSCSRKHSRLGRPVAARERFRVAVLRRFYQRYGELLDDLALRSFDELERALKKGGFLAKFLDRVLPLPRADKLVARLLTSPAALAEAAEGILDPGEQKLLLRDRPSARRICAGASTTCRSSTRRARWWTARRAGSGT